MRAASGKLADERVGLLDWLANRYGGKRYGAAGDLTPEEAAALSILVKARRDTLAELMKVDDALLLKLQR